MSRAKINPEIPELEALRLWVGASLLTLKISPAAVSKAVGGGVNSLGAFLREPGRDITLGRAADIERFLRQAAREKKTTLPAITRRKK